jgi:hypothetical protein
MPEFVVRLMFGNERADLFLTGQKVHPKRTLASSYQFHYNTIEEAAAEFARVNLTQNELSRRTSETPSTWAQTNADYSK